MSTLSARALPLLASLFIAVATSACAMSVDRPTPADMESETSDAGPELTEPTGEPGCDEGSTVSCKVILPTHDSTENCFVGVRLCINNTFSECGDEAQLREKYGSAARR